MEKNPFKWPYSVTFGFLTVIFEVVFVLIAISFWSSDSSSFTLMDNWQSDLGNPSWGYNSVEGAFYYNAGQVLTGLSLFMFSGGLHIIKVEGKGNKFLYLGQIFGMLTGFAIIMNGIYSEYLGWKHTLWSTTLFLGMLPSVLFLSLHAFRHERIHNAVAFFGFVSFVVDLVFVITYIPIIEWMVIMMMVVWVALYASNLFKNEVLDAGSLSSSN